LEGAAPERHRPAAILQRSLPLRVAVRIAICDAFRPFVRPSVRVPI
jgi:hypothetical protein